MEWIWLIIVGAIVGALGRFINPGRDPMGWIVTILLGIASLIVAGLIFDGALQFIVGVVVASSSSTVYGRVMGGRDSAVTAPVGTGSTASGSRPRGNRRTAVSPQSSSRQMYVSTTIERSSIS